MARILPTVVLVGRMNVGKSTLFNRLASHARSIVLDYAGVTRDVLRDDTDWRGVPFTLIDTGGITAKSQGDDILAKVQLKAWESVEQAAVAVFVVDGTVGVVQEDRLLAQRLHKLGIPVILAVNKSDVRATREQMHEFAQLGFGAGIPISAHHGMAMEDLLDAVLTKLPAGNESQAVEEVAYKVVFIGRPNVGKSSLMNKLVGSERSIVSAVPGTTREAISERVAFSSEHLMITDTPGMRRQRAIDGNLEPLMVKSALAATRSANIVVLMLDGTEGKLADQDLKLAFFAFTDLFKGLVIVVNKQDAMTPQDRADLERSMDYYRHMITKVPVINISCATGQNIDAVLPTIQELWERENQDLPAADLKRLCISELDRKPLVHQKQKLELYNVKQIDHAPITIEMRVNQPDWYGPSELAFFENLMRREYPLEGVPIRFVVRRGHPN